MFFHRPQVETEELVSTLEAIVDKFGEDIGSYAVELARKLAEIFERYRSSTDEADDEDVAENGERGQIFGLQAQSARTPPLRTQCLLLRPHQGQKCVGKRYRDATSMSVVAGSQDPDPCTKCAWPLPVHWLTITSWSCGAAEIAAHGCLRAITTLLESVAKQKALLPALEEVLFPIMQKYLSTEGQDMFEDILEMLSHFTFFPETISSRLWSLWPQLHACVVEWAIDYMEYVLVPLDNFISRSTEHFVTCKNPDYLQSVYQMVQHSLTGEYEEFDIQQAASLMEIVLQNCRGRVDQWVEPYIALTLSKLKGRALGGYGQPDVGCKHRLGSSALHCPTAVAVQHA